MIKHKKPTEAELIFGAFCDGYMQSMKLLPEINYTEDLHKVAKQYVKDVLSNQEEQDND